MTWKEWAVYHAGLFFFADWHLRHLKVCSDQWAKEGWTPTDLLAVTMELWDDPRITPEKPEAHVKAINTQLRLRRIRQGEERERQRRREESRAFHGGAEARKKVGPLVVQIGKLPPEIKENDDGKNDG